MKGSNLIATKYGMDRAEKPPRSSGNSKLYPLLKTLKQSQK